MTVKNLLQEFDLKNSRISVSNYAARTLLINELNSQIKNLSAPQDEVAAELAIFANHPCNEFTISWIKDSDMPTWIMVAQFHPSIKYLESLCRILECDAPLIWHEGIVDILYDLKDERAISSLEKALTYDIPSDPWRHLGIKILETLYVIGTPRAIEIIKSFHGLHHPNFAKQQIFFIDKVI